MTLILCVLLRLFQPGCWVWLCLMVCVLTWLFTIACFRFTVCFSSARAIFRWKVEGPKTMLWLSQAFLGQAMAPTQRHHWWRSLLRLGAADPGVDESAFLHELIEVAACRDQLNLAALECFELVSSRLQLWEETYSAQLRRAESGDTGTAWLDERAIFFGAGRSRGHALVRPTWEIYVVDKLASESAVL